VLYAGALAWLLAPLWYDSPGEPARATESPAAPTRSIGIAPLATSEPLPRGLPGAPAAASTAPQTSAGDSTASVSSGTGADGSTAAPSNRSSFPVTPKPSPESQDQTIINFDG
jgi:hypothetical protein